MKLNLRMLTVAFVLGVSFVLAACGGGSGGGGGSEPAASGGGATTLEIGSAGENLQYEPASLSASAGQEVAIQFKNNSAAQQHNWVLVRGDAAVADAVAAEGLGAGAGANFLPSDQSNIIAHTPLANGGETVDTTFTAPEAGTYSFVCTVPGHSTTMKGTLTVN